MSTAPMATIGATGEPQMLTYQELWAKASNHYGAIIAPSTFRRWISEFCLLEIRSEYEISEAEWVIELAKIARRHPKGSPKIKQTLTRRMQEYATK